MFILLDYIYLVCFLLKKVCAACSVFTLSDSNTTGGGKTFFRHVRFSVVLLLSLKFRFPF